jgi:hypothetical protein
VSGTVALSASANGTGISSLQFEVSGRPVGAAVTAGACVTSWDTRAFTNGVHTVTAAGRDSAGATVWAAPILVTVNNAGQADTTPPTVSITSPTAGATLSGTVTIRANVSDNVAVSGVWFTLDGATLSPEAAPVQGVATWSWPTNTASAGSHVLRAVARDSSGNTANSATVTVTVSNGTSSDTTSPTVALTAPASGATVSGTVTLTATASDNVGVAGVRFTVDGAPVGSEDVSAPFSVSWNTAGSPNGAHALRAVARDAAGNATTSAAINVNVNNTSADSTPPTVSISSPVSGVTINGTITVTATASDNVAVTSVQFTVDGTNIGAPDTSAPWSVAWDTRTAGNGARILRAIARDAAGNTGSSDGRTVTVNNTSSDTVLPTVSLSSPASGATVSGQITIAASASDNVGVAGVQFLVNGTAAGAEDTSAPYSITWATTSVTNGPLQIAAVARDAAGNRRTSEAITVTVANQEAKKAVRGDLNGDDKPDLVFVHAPTGQLHAWFMDGYRKVGEGTFSPERVPAGWEVASIDDFNGDGKSDLIVEETATGRAELWAMNGLVRVNVVRLVEETRPWRVAATGDLDADGDADIIWHDPETGRLFYWLLDDGAVRSEGFLTVSQPNLAWRVAGAADLNGDDKADLLWRNQTSGELQAWLMNGSSRLDIVRPSPGSAATAWEFGAIGDFDGNGHADLVWQHRSMGYLYIWFMNGTNQVSQRFLSPSAIQFGWRVVGVR